MSFLAKKIIDFEPKIFGIDLSDLSIKVLQLEKNGDFHKIRCFSSFDIAPGNIEDGKIENKEKVIAVIKEAVSKSYPRKLNTNKVICSLPESKAFLRMIKIPKMKEEEIGEAIKWEMEANIPLPIDQVYFDWQLLGQDAKNMQNILTVAVPKEVVDDSMEVLEKSGLDVYGLELESIATSRSLMSNEFIGKNFASLIVDLGSQRTSFIMIVNGSPYFTSSIPFSSEGINDAISKAMNVDSKKAEEFKVHYGIENVNNDNPIFKATQSLLENLVSEVEKTLDFYREMFKDEAEKIEKIILCGGGANLKGLVPYLSKRLSKNIEIGNAWSNLNFGKNLPIINKESSVRYPTVIGLALRGLNYYGD